MQRRNFIRLVGGGTVVAASAGGITACALGPAYPAQAVEIWRGPGTEADVRKRALAYAVTAPNPHNRQPWLVDLGTPRQITLYCDRERLLPETDPFGRQILIGHGCFLELLVMALTRQGVRAQVTLWPEGELAHDLANWERKPVARLQLTPDATIDRTDALFDRVLQRHTPKMRYDTARPVPAALLQQLVSPAPEGNAVRLGGTVDMARVEPLRQLCLAAAKVEMSTARTAMESLRLMRIGPREILAHRDGISINGALPRMLVALGQFDRSVASPAGSMAFDKTLEQFSDYSLTAMGFVWVATAGNTRVDQIAAGRAYVRQQLQAVALGIGLHPMSQALQEFPEMATHYQAVHRMVLGVEAPRDTAAPTLQVFSRIGYPVAVAPTTPRRALDDFVLA